MANRLGSLVKGYVPLWCKSHFSLLEGASHPEECIDQAKALGLDTIALTDRDSVGGAPRAAAAARRAGIKLIYGAELTLPNQRRMTLLAQDRGGYAKLTQLLSKAHQNSTQGSPCIDNQSVCDAAQGCFALIGGDDGWMGAKTPILQADIDALKEAFKDRLFMRISNHRHPIERQRKKLLIERSRRFSLPIVAANEHLYHHPDRQQLSDILSCVRAQCTLEEAGTKLRRNNEHALESFAGFRDRFRQHPGWLEQSIEIARRCQFDLFSLRYRYPYEQLPKGMSGIQYLAELARAGAAKRYRSSVPSKVIQQLNKELELVGSLEYEGYFLTMWEIVRFCKEQEILCQGRGSAANSALCFCLEITAVDPMQHDLLFERFLSQERREPPDIDLDIAHERREEVIQYVYQKYGRRYAAMVSVNVRYRMKSAIRDSGKVLNITQKSIDKLAKMAGGHRREIPRSAFEAAQLDADQAHHKTWVRLAEQMIDTPRHRSIHPGGFLLGHEPVDALVPITKAAMKGRTVIQWDKQDIETLGLFKVDLLGLGMLSQLQRCFDLIRRYPPVRFKDIIRPKDHDMLARLPADDPDTYAMLSEADSLGVFQIESRAQMNMLPRLKPKRFYDLVVEIAIIRPGPISGDMVHPYLRRRDGIEPIVYPHPSLEPILTRTLGVPLFQEQVMRIAMVAADYSPGEADQLRRDMAAWKSSGRIERHKGRLIERMINKGISSAFAERVYEQIKGFGEYGFPESHAISFALISYATAFLKKHAPAHFYAALINAQPMGFYSTSSLVYGAQREGVDVLPVDIRYSRWDCDLELKDGRTALRMGFRTIKGLGPRERLELDPPSPRLDHESLAQYARRLRLKRTVLESLAEAGAFEVFGPRRSVLWQLSDPGLSRGETLVLSEAQAPDELPDLNAIERIAWDQRRSAHSTRGHPFALLRTSCDQQGFLSASGLAQSTHQSRVSSVGLVICRQRPSTASGVTFVTLEDETGFINLVIWKQTAERFKRFLRGSAILAASGRVQREGAITHLIVHRLWEPEWDAQVAPVPSHDYR